MQFAGIPSHKVLVIDCSSKNFAQHFYFLRSAFPYGLPILFCESIWNIPRFEQPSLEPEKDISVVDDQTTVRDGSSQETDNRTSQPTIIDSQSENTMLNNVNPGATFNCPFDESQMSGVSTVSGVARSEIDTLSSYTTPFSRTYKPIRASSSMASSHCFTDEKLALA